MPLFGVTAWANYHGHWIFAKLLSQHLKTLNRFLRREKTMLIDICFFGIPLVIAVCFVAHAVRDQNQSFWLPSFALFAYCGFYITGGREVLLWLIVAVLMGGGWVGGGAPV